MIGSPFPASVLSVTFAGRTAAVSSLAEASRKWTEFRDASGAGVSQIGNGLEVVDGGGNIVARVSYNGRIWNPDGTPMDAVQG